MVIQNDKLLKKILLIIAVFALGFIFFKFVFDLVLPFLIAFAIAYILQNPIRILEKRTRLKRRILSAIFVVIAVFLCGFILFLLCNRLISEVERFAFAVSENSDEYVTRFFEFVDSIAIRIPFFEHVGTDLTSAVSDSIKDILKSSASQLPGMLARIIGMLPQILLFTVILIMASYYFCADFDSLVNGLKEKLPQRIISCIGAFKRSLTDKGLSYLKASLILMLITYVELLIGLLVLGVQYAFTMALIIAAVDMLPILGVGSVLVPWALWCWISGDSYTAIGLIIIYVTVTIIRRFIEPRVIGSGIGLSPLMTLLSMYVGFKLFGVTGLIFAPLIGVLIKSLIASFSAENGSQ